MRKIILNILICVIFLNLTGCKIKEDISNEKLNNINNEIINYFEKNGVENYDNYCYNYVDEKNKVVIVGLVDNSKKNQEWFKKNIVDSKYIRFEKGEKSINVSNKIDIIINNGPLTSSNPFDYIKASQKEYDELLKNPKETFEYAIKDLIETNANNGLKSYIEALLCKEINKNFEYDFISADDYLENYKTFLNKSNLDFNDYDKYAISLLK